MTTTLTFWNHAGFMIETERSVLLVDPWLEGKAFYEGWALLDQTTSNAEVYEALAARLPKQLWIWFSHEHPDHFPVPFVRGLAARGLKPTVLYQATLDGRVKRFVEKQGLAYRECHAGVPAVLDEALQLVVWPYGSGDSFAIISAGGRRILNLNDCVVASKQEARDIKRRIGAGAPIDVLFTQFGYANWVGNEADAALRRDAAREKLERIAIQVAELAPARVTPFASFSYFCHAENAYLNDGQNAPADVRRAESLAGYQARIGFLKPRDTIELDAPGWRDELERLSQPAERHWEQLEADRAERAIPDPSPKVVPMEELLAQFSVYRAELQARLGPLPKLLEYAGFVRPIRVQIDGAAVVRLSFVSEPAVLSPGSDEPWDLSVSSDVLRFILKNEFGFDTIDVSGRLRINHAGVGRRQLRRFFKPQVLARNGYGLKQVVPTARVLGGYFVKNVGLRLRSRLQAPPAPGAPPSS